MKRGVHQSVGSRVPQLLREELFSAVAFPLAGQSRQSAAAADHGEPVSPQAATPADSLFRIFQSDSARPKTTVVLPDGGNPKPETTGVLSVATSPSPKRRLSGSLGEAPSLKQRSFTPRWQPQSPKRPFLGLMWEAPSPKRPSYCRLWQAPTPARPSFCLLRHSPGQKRRRYPQSSAISTVNHPFSPLSPDSQPPTPKHYGLQRTPPEY